MTVHGPQHLKTAREALGKYIHCDADDVVLVTNPSYGINIIAKSFQLQEGDEILSTNLEYGALDRTWNYNCKKVGAKYVRQKISLPLVSKEQFIKNYFEGLTVRTKAIFISHITSATALIFPVKEICEMAKAKGLFTIVDGAHASGHIPVNITGLDPDVYVGACHKWMCAPKGCSFLYVKKKWQHLFDPLLISWGYKSMNPSHSQFLDYHQLQGTRDYSAFLTFPETIKFLQENNWMEQAATCRQLAQSNYQRFCDLLGSQPLCPVSDEFLGQMCSIPISTSHPEALQKLLFEKYKIEIPVMKQDQNIFIRYSIQAFNTQQDLDQLYGALSEIMDEGS
jgi:isopenicillin-N epimerase